MTNTSTAPVRLSGREKLFVDYGPLAVFFIAYFFGAKLIKFAGGLTNAEWCLKAGAEMYVSLIVFLPTFALAFAYSVFKEKRVAPMLGLTGAIVCILGVLTLILQNKTFFYMKPSIIYALFGAILLSGHFTGRNFLKLVFDGGLHLSDDAWRILTIRYAVFFFVLALANEIAWRWLTRDCGVAATPSDIDAAGGWLLGACNTDQTAASCPGEAAWVNLKIFGFTAANFLFVAAQMPLIMKNMPDEDATDTDATDTNKTNAQDADTKD